MTNELTMFKNGFTPSTAFKDMNLPKARLDDGVGGAAWARIAYKGKDWAVRNGAKVAPLMRVVDGRQEKNPNLDIVILEAANHPSRRWYKQGYNDGDANAPDCYSTKGFKPDDGSTLKQSETCALCPNNAWGTKPGSRGKACSEYKNLAVVPVGDIENKINGGPMMLAVPPNSLKPLAQYQMQLEASSLHYAMVHTRVTFGEGLFSFDFDALAALDDVQAAQVGRMLKHPLVRRILDEEAVPMGEGERSNAQPSASIHQLKPPEPAAPAAKAEEPAVQAQPEQDEIAKLRAELLAAKKAAEPKPEPELTADQKMIAELKAQIAATAAAARKAVADDAPAKPRGRPPRSATRTPPVTPANVDSEKLAGPALPEPVGPVPDVDLPAPGNDDAISRINQTISRAKDLI